MSVINVCIRRCLTMLIIVLSVFSHATTWAASVTLSWNSSPNPAVAGYTVYYGLASGDYSWSIDAGASTNATISGLNPALTYYFAVSCYDSAWDESPLSSEIIDSIPFLPLITSAPANQTVIAGGTASFTVSAASTVPLTYQWFDGATASARSHECHVDPAQCQRCGCWQL